MTATQAAQLEARLKDKWWRLTNLYLILTEDGATEPLTMRAEQVEFLTNRHNRNFVPKARKLGMSTVIVLDNLDECIFRPDTKAGIIDLTREDAHAKLAMAKFAWDNGPFHPDPAIAALWREIHKANPLKKDTAGALEWKNGSEFTAGVAFTGRTPQRLHISEYGPISARSPNKASAIKRGAINSVPPDGIIDIETTMEGGRFGECYAIFKLALSKVGKPVTKMDWKLHFFPWLGHPSYVLPGQKPSQADTIEYFAKVKRDHGVDVPLGRQAWYERKKAEQQGEMWQQFPTTIEEVDRLTVPGQIYPEMKSVRAGGRVVAFEPEKGLPTFTSWDLGSSDNMAGWLIQPAGKAHNFLDWCSGEGAGAAGVAQVVRAWEERHGSILAHFLPHDCNITDKGSGKTFLQQLIECGIPAEKLIVTPRIPDVWVGIDEVRRILPNCWFHERTDQPVTVDGAADLPGGVGRLEGYRKQIVQSTNIVKDVPVHDICSHTCLAEGTQVLMADESLCAIESISPGDKVWTPVGPCEVTIVHRNGIQKVRSFGPLFATVDHKVFTASGLIRCDSMRTFTKAWTHRNAWSLTGGDTTSGRIKDITGRIPIVSAIRAAIFTGTFGFRKMETFRRVFTFITKMGTRSIMTSQTLSAFAGEITARITQRLVIGSGPKKIENSLLQWAQKRRNGTDQKRAGNGTGSTVEKRGTKEPRLPKLAKCAERISKPRRFIRSFAEGFASRDSTTSLSLLLTQRAMSAGQPLSTSRKGKIRNTATALVTRRLKIGSEESERPVFDLTVDEAHCYVANGVLVSNCDAVRTYAEALSRDMVGAHMVKHRGPTVVLSGFVGTDAPISWEVGDEEGGAVVLM